MIAYLGAFVLAALVEPASPAERARALEPLASHFSDRDYPEASQRRQAEGVTHFSLEIDARGAPSRCIIDYSSGDADLDRATCDIVMSRARFRPARDGSGRPVPDRVSRRVRWVLPDPLPGYPFEATWMTSSTSITNGRIACQWSSSGAEPQRREGMECAETSGRETLDRLRSLGADAELTEFWRIQPNETQRASGEPTIAGALLLEETVRLSVAPDGHVADCRSTARSVHQSLARIGDLPGLCQSEMLSKPGAFWPDNDQTEPRLGSLTYRLYGRGPHLVP
jgi:TonB family protein